MSEINNVYRWTSDHLRKPGGTGVYGAQQRERFRQMADEVRALLHEYKSDLETIRLDGDKPFEARIRAFLASRPLAQLENDLRQAIKHAGRVDTEYQRRYVQLPEKRKEKAEKKELEKAQKKGLEVTSSANTAGQLNGVAQTFTDTTGNDKGNAKKTSKNGDAPSFLDYLEKGA